MTGSTAQTTFKPIFIAVAGGSGSGKTTLSRKLAYAFGQSRALILSQDSYYHDQSAHFDGDGGSVNYDHPDAIDFKLLAQHLLALKKDQSVEVPVYNFVMHKRLKLTHHVEPKSIVIVDGTLLLSQEILVPLFQHRIFLDVPEQIRFERRLKRDVEERGREPEGVRQQFEQQVAPMHNAFVQPSLKNANWIVNHGQDLNAWIQEFLNAVI